MIQVEFALGTLRAAAKRKSSMIKTVVCHCGKKWQLQRLKLGILQEESYSFHCTCGLHLCRP
jgi:hypothetical protein